ncbi:MAG TPA: hypothetical protein VN363_04500, partial [Anaerolineales bacterium]|nr:hypothetical protein [Anaerolineales bacterium]
MQIDLIWLSRSGGPPAWPHGDMWSAAPTPAGVAGCVAQNLPACTSDAWLFWDSELGAPDPEKIARALERPGDAWHAGLRLGLGG